MLPERTITKQAKQATAGNDATRAVSLQRDKLSPSVTEVVKAALLILGTTIGGGFLALPSTVVVPLGGFPVTLVSLTTVWLFLLAASWVLIGDIVTCHRETGKDALGIVYLTRHVFPGREKFALALLVVLTEATFVSQLARAGILVGGIRNYRAGCIATAAVGAMMCQREGLATNTNALLTIVFLVSAVLMFQAGQSSAVWSRCFASSATMNFATVARAVPVQLQLLVYGEILPNICRMLQYDKKSIAVALTIGSGLPLLLLTGWAALGVALVPSLSTAVDPVTILLQHSTVQRRLAVLAVSAIGTTVLGCYLALQSAYRDAVTTRSSPNWMETLIIAGPPTVIACLSPSLFGQAIAFAGAYPVLLLFGVLPAALSVRMHNTQTTWLTRVLGLLSVGMVAASAVTDIQKLLAWLGTTLLALR